MWNPPNASFGLIRSLGGQRNALVPGIPWAADNGCFARPDAYDTKKYLDWIVKLGINDCLFACAPDIVGDHAATIQRSLPVLPLIRNLGTRAMLVAQDGLTPALVPWSDIDGIFIGGTTDWKLSPAARLLVEEANKRELWTHMGRVNSRKRVMLAHSWGCDSVDGNILAFGKDVHLPRLTSWMKEINNV